MPRIAGFEQKRKLDRMADKRSLLRRLPRIYFWGWVALAPLVILAGLMMYMSFDRKFEYFLEGLWIGILNLGILWTAMFVLVSVIIVVARVSKPNHRQPVATANSFRKEFLSIYPLGWTVLVASGFISEFLTHTFTIRGSFLATVALGFVPMTLGTALIAFVRSRDRAGTVASPRAAHEIDFVSGPSIDCVRLWPIAALEAFQNWAKFRSALQRKAALEEGPGKSYLHTAFLDNTGSLQSGNRSCFTSS